MTEPFYSLKFHNQIECVSLSPFEWSQNLVCFSTEQKLHVGVLKFQDEYDDLEEEIEFEQLEEFVHSARVNAIAWCPTASLNKLPKTIELCTAGSDFNIRFFFSDRSANRHVRKEIQGHSDYVNDCSFDYEGEYLASVSDDFTCKLWSYMEFELLHTFMLTSAGVAVSWHQDESSKLLVGEKSGLLRLYCIRTLQPISSHSCYSIPLTSLSWSLQSKLVAVLTAGELSIRDITLAGHVIDNKVVHVGGGYTVAFCLTNENYVATIGKPSNTLKISHIRHKQPLISTSLSVYGGASWHYRLPYLCVANNNLLSFFKISPK